MSRSTQGDSTHGPTVLGGTVGFLDYPVFGSVLFALGLWELADRPDADRAARAVRLLVLADRFGYNRQLPSLAWEPGRALAEELAPGEVTRVRAEVADVPTPELRGGVGELLAELSPVVE